MADTLTRHAHAQVNGRVRRSQRRAAADELGFLRNRPIVDQNDRSAHRCRRNEQIELKKCSTKLPANEPTEMHSD